MAGRERSGTPLVALFLVAAVGAAISLVRARAGTVDLWFDDSWIAIASRSGLGATRWLNGVPGFTVVARWWIGLRPGDVAWAQDLALVAYLLTVPAVYWSARRACGSRRAALAAGALAALAPVLITESARLKQYTTESVVSAVMVGLAAGAAHHLPTMRRVAASALVIAAGVVLSGALLMPAGVLGVVLVASEVRAGTRARTGRRRRVLVLGAALLFVAVWVAAVLSQVSSGYNQTWRSYGAFLGSRGTLGGTVDQLLDMVRGFGGGFLPGGSRLFASPLVGAVVLVAMTVYVVVRRRAVWWLALAPVAAIVGSAAARYPLGPIGYARVDSWLFPWIAVLGAQMLTDAGRWAAGRFGTARVRALAVPVLGAGLVVVVIGALFSVSSYPTTRAAVAARVLVAPPTSEHVYLDQSDMPVLLRLPGGGRLVRADAEQALNSIYFRPDPRFALLNLRAVARHRAAATLAAHCGEEVVVVGSSDEELRPVLRALPCAVTAQHRRTQGTAEHWDDVVTIRLGAAPPAGFEPATHGLGNRRSIP